MKWQCTTATVLVLALLATAVPIDSHAQQAEPTSATAAMPPLWLGTAWYPEAWPESRWPLDLALMQQANVRFVRVAEFAWSRMEPSEGVYDFDWLEKAVDEAAQHNIYTVLGTPSATPPAWLTQKYPETLRIDEDGKRAEHGNRQQFSFASTKYRELCRDIAARMAQRFGHNPHVIGWQIGNEYQKASFDPETRTKWHQWLQQRYSTLDNLNTLWTTSYWSQTYTSWDQIPIETTPGNPGLLLAWKRFVSETWSSFQKNQIDAIRSHADVRQFITTNMLGFDLPFDHYVVARDLDFASWDDYVPQGQLNLSVNGMTNDLTRGFKQKNFWIMETQPGFVNWGGVNRTLAKGEVRALAWHNVGHGADAVAYWQWRSAYNGQEQYHGTLVGANGQPVPVYAEVAQIGAEFAKAGPILANTSPRSQVAILNSYDSIWAINWQRHNEDFNPITQLQSYYRPLRKIAQSVDVVQPTASLARYKLVVAPGLNVLSDDVARNLMAYVRGGGNLVLGQRSGMKNNEDGLQPEDQPGPLADLLGAHVEQFYALGEPVPVSGAFGDNSSNIWAEQLHITSPETRVLAAYGKSNGWLDGQPAIVTRKVGKGSITYVGVWMNDQGMDKLAASLLDESGVKPAFGPLPDGVEVSARYGKDYTIFVLVNLSGSTQVVPLPMTMQDIFKDVTVQSVSLPQFGVSVLQASRR
jgi:beta-galactosidase